MRSYSVIVFDLGNVLIPFDYQRTIFKINQVEPGLGDRFSDFYNNNYHFHRDFERGSLTDDDFISLMLKAADNKINKEQFCNYYSDIFTVNEDVVSLLPLLKEKYKLVLLSNTNSIHRAYGWCRYEFLNYFDKLILSHEVKVVKPEADIYKAVEDFSKQPAEQHLFIDDIPEYVQAAKTRGWDGIVFQNYNQLSRELLEKGIL